MRNVWVLLIVLIGSDSYCQCDFIDTYDNPIIWSQVGTDIQVANGKLEFSNGSACGEQKRVYRSLGIELAANTWWSASVRFKPVQLGMNSGNPFVGHLILSLTAGDQEPLNDCPDIPCTGNPNGVQDGLIVRYSTDNPPTGEIYFSIIARDSVDEITSDYITVNEVDTSMYIQMERISPTAMRLSIFMDESKTIHHQGSPISFAIPATIEGLNTVQHGNSARGWDQRELTGEVDDLCIEWNLPTTILSKVKSENNILLFPNPASDIVNIVNNSDHLGCIKILASTGEVVYLSNLSRHNALVDLRNIDPGLYFVQIMGQSHVRTEKLIVN